MVSPWSFGFLKVYPQTSFRWWNFLAKRCLKLKRFLWTLPYFSSADALKPASCGALTSVARGPSHPSPHPRHGLEDRSPLPRRSGRIGIVQTLDSFFWQSNPEQYVPGKHFLCSWEAPQLLEKVRYPSPPYRRSWYKTKAEKIRQIVTQKTWVSIHFQYLGI